MAKEIIDIIILLALPAVIASAVVLIFFQYMRERLAQDCLRRVADLERRVRQIEERAYLSQPPQEQGPQRWVNQRRLERIEQAADPERRVRQIEERAYLNQPPQEQVAQNRAINQRLPERMVKKLANGGREAIAYWPPPSVHLKTARRMNDEYPQPWKSPRCSLEELEKVAVNLLALVEPEGRGSPLAHLSGLNNWLGKNYPGIEAEPISMLNHDLWLLVALTGDRKTGVVIPALDSVIGPGEILKWFEGGRYDGTQALERTNVLTAAKAVRDEETQTWRPHSKGQIQLA